MVLEALTRRSLQLLRMLYANGKLTSTYSLDVKQNDLAGKLGISRQALNVHLRRLRRLKYIRTGRGFIDVTEKGLGVLGASSTPAFVFIKVIPHKRREVYEKMGGLAIRRAFRVAGEVDAILMIERSKLDEVLRKLSSINGVKDTRSYIAIEPIETGENVDETLRV